MRPAKHVTGGQLDTIIRFQALMEPEIRAYISALKNLAKYRLPLKAGRKVIDRAMKGASLSAVLYKARELF